MDVLILHGIDGYAGIHWQGWLKLELEKLGQVIFMPDLPDSGHPHRFEWLQIVKNMMKNVSLSKLIVIGHSLGVVSALDFIEQADSKIQSFISVSGFSEDYGSPLNSYFMKEKEIQISDVQKHIHESNVLFGDDDPYVPQEVLYSLAKQLGVQPEIIKNGGHLNTDSGYETFPRLVEIVRRIEKNYLAS